MYQNEIFNYLNRKAISIKLILIVCVCQRECVCVCEKSKLLTEWRHLMLLCVKKGKYRRKGNWLLQEVLLLDGGNEIEKISISI